MRNTRPKPPTNWPFHPARPRSVAANNRLFSRRPHFVLTQISPISQRLRTTPKPYHTHRAGRPQRGHLRHPRHLRENKNSPREHKKRPASAQRAIYMVVRGQKLAQSRGRHVQKAVPSPQRHIQGKYLTFQPSLQTINNQRVIKKLQKGSKKSPKKTLAY